ncbi:MAG: Uma2 family endonuclease [Gemmataceae bacterium]
MSQVVAQRPPVRDCLRLSNVDWKTYTQLLRVFEERPGYRLTYDGGELEILAPSHRHDHPGSFFSFLIQILTEELGLPLRAGGSTTMRKKKKQRGLEPDECFWIANAAALAGVDELDLSKHPPADLALEVDVTNSSLDRMSIYETLQVPEVWRMEDGVLTFHVLVAGQYQPATHSLSFPKVRPAELLPFVQEARQVPDNNAVLRQFRAWVRRHHGLANP